MIAEQEHLPLLSAEDMHSTTQQEIGIFIAHVVLVGLLVGCIRG